MNGQCERRQCNTLLHVSHRHALSFSLWGHLRLLLCELKRRYPTNKISLRQTNHTNADKQTKIINP